MIIVSGQIHLVATELERAHRAGSAMAATSRSEPGCVDYRFAMDIDDPLCVHLLEKWESEEALEAHFASAHFAAFAELLVDVVDGDAEFMRYEVASSRPLFG